ncbi:hypothetical protein COU79_04020 [Candidatus Peregrinibacteria bacterium CG10_big_fil_rev_8_21_14_0_10_54_7]|nr:MAG: hypothetical protein COU79_04020 [Candidatus Peregrinibacteria bacterium CG10_big_fil_rev_8_21_14_0_10_54_7]
MPKYVIGIDVGGTNIKTGIVSQKGVIVARSNLITGSYIRNKMELIEALVEHLKGLLAANGLKPSQVLGIGIGLPGLIDPPEGIVRFLPNIPGWKNVRLQRILEQKLHIPTFLENDVNMIALGEWRYGAGKRSRNMLCMTLGTGVGGGLILNNELYRGPGYVAGEIGHIPLNERGPRCNCGGSACFERAVGHRYLLQKALKIFHKRNLTLQDVTSMALAGNKRAVRFWEETAVHIGNALTGVVNVLNPERIVIGGGVSNCPGFLFRKIQQTIKHRAMSVQGKMARVVKAQLGNDAGLVGAYVLVKGSC